MGYHRDFLLPDLLRDFAPCHIVSDNELMKGACERYLFCFSRMSLRLRTDIPFLDELLKVNPEICLAAFLQSTILLRRVSNETRPLVYAILKQTLGLFAVKEEPSTGLGLNFNQLVVSIGRTEWARQDRVVVEAWFKAGLPYVRAHKALSLSLHTDQEVFLMIADNCLSKYKKQAFLRSSHKLRSDKTFMMKVVAKDPSLFSCASMQ